MHNDYLGSRRQTRLIFHCMEQLTHTAVESGQRRTHMHIQRNPYTHYILLFGFTSEIIVGLFFYPALCKIRLEGMFSQWKTLPRNATR